MARFFTKEELRWLKSLVEDYIRFRAVFESGAAFLKITLRRWFERYPYRHPRLSRHRAEGDDGSGLLIAGDRWKNISEVS